VRTARHRRLDRQHHADALQPAPRLSMSPGLIDAGEPSSGKSEAQMSREVQQPAAADTAKRDACDVVFQSQKPQRKGDSRMETRQQCSLRAVAHLKCVHRNAEEVWQPGERLHR
jgi:hypothetical protein